MRQGGGLEQSTVPASLESLPEDMKADLMRVSELAYNGLMRKGDVQVMFTDEEVRFQHLGLLNEAKEMYVLRGAATYYSFLHLSIQEFLAAWHVSCHPDLVGSAIPGWETFQSQSHLQKFWKVPFWLVQQVLEYCNSLRCFFR